MKAKVSAGDRDGLYRIPLNRPVDLNGTETIGCSLSMISNPDFGIVCDIHIRGYQASKAAAIVFELLLTTGPSGWNLHLFAIPIQQCGNGVWNSAYQVLTALYV